MSISRPDRPYYHVIDFLMMQISYQTTAYPSLFYLIINNIQDYSTIL